MGQSLVRVALKAMQLLYATLQVPGVGGVADPW